MRKLGLAIGFFVVAALAAGGCTRTATTSSVPPPGSDSSASAAQVVPAATSAPAEPTPASSTSAAAVGEKAYDDTTTSIATRVGDRFTINLPANITTPYKWLVASPEMNVALAERHYQEKPPQDCAGCVGYPGTDRLTFEAKQAGEAKLVLRYAPLRSQEPAEREITIAVAVSKR